MHFWAFTAVLNPFNIVYFLKLYNGFNYLVKQIFSFPRPLSNFFNNDLFMLPLNVTHLKSSLNLILTGIIGSTLNKEMLSTVKAYDTCLFIQVSFTHRLAT